MSHLRSLYYQRMGVAKNVANAAWCKLPNVSAKTDVDCIKK